MTARPGADEERGQTLIEFAITVPLLLILLVGTVDIGRALLAYNSIDNAVRDAAREAAVHGRGASVPWGPTANDVRVRDLVRARAVGVVAQQLVVTSSWPDGNNASASEVVVGASYTFRPVAAELIGNFTIPMSASTRARIYR